ncbi:hypothetical protein BC828DRAFT_396849 [Blastocladiella britannica]|nr:hypothetical protein BC828DRAFT_396849 [Blastocladiella britannica]
MASASSSALVIHGAVAPETGGEHDHLNKSISIATPTVDSDVVALRLGYRTLTQEYTLTKKSKNNKHGASSSDENDDIHKLTQHELELRFATTVDQGLQPDVVSRRLAKFGNNAISPPPTNYFAKATEHLFGGFAGIMWFAGIVVFISWSASCIL